MILYDFQVQANFRYDPALVEMPAQEPRLRRFSSLLWHGYEYGTPVVYKTDPYSAQVIRIVFPH